MSVGRLSPVGIRFSSEKKRNTFCFLWRRACSFAAKPKKTRDNMATETKAKKKERAILWAAHARNPKPGGQRRREADMASKKKDGEDKSRTTRFFFLPAPVHAPPPHESDRSDLTIF